MLKISRNNILPEKERREREIFQGHSSLAQSASSLRGGSGHKTASSWLRF